MRRAAREPSTAADPIPGLARLADALAWPLMVLDDTGRLHHANRVAGALLTRGEPLQQAAGEPVQPRAEAQRSAFCSAVQGAAAGTGTTLCWVTPDGLCSVTLQPLPGGPGTPARCLLTVAPARAWHADVAACARELSLSAIQTRVLHGLAQGEDTAGMAAALGVTASTVRGHVAAVCRKSGYPTAAALVQALKRLPPAVGPAADGQ